MALTKKQRTRTVLAVRFKNTSEISLIKKSAKAAKQSVNSFCRVAILSDVTVEDKKSKAQ